MKLLSIDDEKTNLMLIESMATRIGFAVRSFISPLEALAEMNKEEFDLILVDYMMPDMNGIDFIEKVRQKQSDLPIIMITATIDDERLKIRALEAGATEFLNKPVEIAEFQARIQNLAALRKAQLLLKDRALFLEDEVKKVTESIIDREHETLNVLGRAAEHRDPETAAHISRVAHYCRLIAENLGVGADEGERLFYATPLHDIGKIGIADSILLQPGKLTAEEFSQVKQHTLIGHRILENSESEYLKAGALISLHHHEHFNGGGYPAGISGESIHLHGRIVAIADVFDALTSRRPYKEPWPFERALEHLTKERGAHFDPELVDDFSNSESMVKEIFETFADDD